METRSVPADTGLSQMFAMQMFQGQMMGQERRIEAIEKQSNDIMGLMKKMMKDQKKQKKEKRKKKRKRAHLEKKMKARKVTSEKWTKDTELKSPERMHVRVNNQDDSSEESNRSSISYSSSSSSSSSSSD